MTSPNPGQVTLAVADHVATLTLDRPEKHNAITPAMAARLAELCREVDARDDVRVVLVQGGGRKAFSAGRLRNHSRKPAISGQSAVPDGAISQSPASDPSVTRSQRASVLVAKRSSVMESPPLLMRRWQWRSVRGACQ